MWRLLLADLHVGSETFDVIAFKKLVQKLAVYEPLVDEVIILGDLLEGQLNYSAQQAHALPLPLQKELLLRVLTHLDDVLRPNRFIILAGNHDKKHNIDLLKDAVFEFRINTSAAVLYYDSDYVVYDNVLLLHRIKNTGGSDYYAATPLILANATALASSIERTEQKRIDVVGLGHYHKLAIFEYAARHFIFLPSFASFRPLRNERAVVLLSTFADCGGGVHLNVIIESVPPTPLDVLRKHYAEKINALLDF